MQLYKCSLCFYGEINLFKIVAGKLKYGQHEKVNVAEPVIETNVMQRSAPGMSLIHYFEIVRIVHAMSLCITTSSISQLPVLCCNF
jgi:hypothetical protein